MARGEGPRPARPHRHRPLAALRDGAHGVVELAEASGLSRLSRDERDPIRASTAGTGELIRAVLEAGVRRLVLGIGGSATTDGGAGILAALGAVAERDASGPVDLAGLDPRLAGTDLRIACDVTNPLLGPTGAAATYGPQKGATAEQVADLDRRLAGWADGLEAATGRRERDTPGAGAAGGVGFGLLCLRDRFGSLELVPGVDLVAEETGLDAKLARADVVVTGEGRIDAQTAFGKTALGVARRAQAAGVRCIAVGGGVETRGCRRARRLRRGGRARPPTAPIEVEAAIAAGAAPLDRVRRAAGPLDPVVAMSPAHDVMPKRAEVPRDWPRSDRGHARLEAAR